MSNQTWSLQVYDLEDTDKVFNSTNPLELFDMSCKLWQHPDHPEAVHCIVDPQGSTWVREGVEVGNYGHIITAPNGARWVRDSNYKEPTP